MKRNSQVTMMKNSNHNNMSLLYRINQVVIENKPLKEIARETLKILSNDLNFKRSMITIFNRKTGEIFAEESDGFTRVEERRAKYNLGEGITGKVVQSGNAFVIPMVSKEPDFLNKTGARDVEHNISFICVPIKYENEIIGTINVDCENDGESEISDYIKILYLITSIISGAVKKHQIEHELDYGEDSKLAKIKPDFKPENIIGESKEMLYLYSLIEKVSKSNATVLILGESGVGKELVARAIYDNSERRGEQYITFNCGAIPEHLVESELFGHEKGAFSGAYNTRKGKFELANSGVLFLDEIGELPMQTQVKFLRVLQEKELERVGGEEKIKIDVRIIAATNKDLSKLINNNKFREDLYYRLNVFPIIVPPLRKRKSDIPILVDYFIKKYSKQNNKFISYISKEAIDNLISYNWPGNVRELENCIERAVVLTSESAINSFHLPLELSADSIPLPNDDSKLNDRLEYYEKEIIIDILRKYKGNIVNTAKKLGITQRILRLRLEKYGIENKSFK